MRLPAPLHRSVLQVTGSIVESMKFQCELRSDFLQPSLLPSIIKDVTMPSDKDKITLIMERHGLSSLELWVMREKGDEQAANCMPESGGKIVQNKLRVVRTGSTMIMNLFVELDRGKLEDGSWSFGKLNDTERVKSLPGLVHHNKMCEFTVNSSLNHILEDMVAITTMELGKREQVGKFIGKVKSSRRGSASGCDQDLGRESLDEER